MRQKAIVNIITLFSAEGQNESSCKRARAEVPVPQNGSAFESFTRKSANMPKVWENILSHTSGGDVANCLKVCKGLRNVIEQCISSSTRFRHEIDVAATTAAMAKSRIHSKLETKFRWKMPLNYDYMFALDDMWYYMRPEVDKIEFIQLDQSSKSTKKGSFRTKRCDTYPSFVIHPTQDPSKVFVQDPIVGLYPVKLGQGVAEMIPEHYTIEGKYNSRFEKGHDRPCYIRYRLFVCSYGAKDNNSKTATIFITLTDENGLFDRSKVLYKMESLHFKHLASNEEVMENCHTFCYISLFNSICLYVVTISPLKFK